MPLHALVGPRQVQQDHHLALCGAQEGQSCSRTPRSRKPVQPGMLPGVWEPQGNAARRARGSDLTSIYPFPRPTGCTSPRGRYLPREPHTLSVILCNWLSSGSPTCQGWSQAHGPVCPMTQQHSAVGMLAAPRAQSRLPASCRGLAEGGHQDQPRSGTGAPGALLLPHEPAGPKNSCDLTHLSLVSTSTWGKERATTGRLPGLGGLLHGPSPGGWEGARQQIMM